MTAQPLPPLANVMAIRLTATEALARIEDEMNSSRSFDAIVRPHDSWIVAVSHLPGARQLITDRTRTFFVEGSDLFSDEHLNSFERAVAGVDARRLAEFAGDFGLLHFDTNGLAVVVRSAGGRVPFYVLRRSGLVAVSTRLTDLARWVPGELQYDLMVCALWTTGWTIFPDNRTFFRDIATLPRGHRQLIQPGDATLTDCYWDPRPTTVRWPAKAIRREHVARFRSILIDYLARELDDELNLLTLSGGVDSSSLAALAAGTLQKPIDTLSLLPRDETYLADERRYLDSIAAAVPIQRRWEFPMTVADRVELVRKAPAVAFPMLHPALGALPEVASERRPSVLFGGEFADEVAGSTFTFPDWLDQTSLSGLIRRPWAWPQGRYTPRAWLDHRRRSLRGQPFFPWPSDLPRWVAPALADEYRTWRARRLTAFAFDSRPLRWLALHAEADGFIAMNWEAASELRLRRAWPFFNREMLELAFECHPSELVGPGTKKLLRTALRDDVPEENLQRPDRGHWPSPEESIDPPPSAAGLQQLFAPKKWTEEAGEWPTFWKWVLATFARDVAEVRSGVR